MSKLFIPSKIKVGFQERKDTFTGKLAYIIYFDEKGVLRKEKSWLSWCDDKIESFEFENTPRSGYLFNKGVQRYGYHWGGSGRSMVRIYDPRDFEFEITVDNVIGILMHSDVSKRDIVEECVFAWDGTELVLLPVNSENYQESLKYTEKQSEKVSAKDLVKGYTYQQKKSDTLFTYIGYYEWFDWDTRYDYGDLRTHKASGKKKHVFYDGKNFVTPGIATFSSVVSEEVAENYASLVEQFFKTDNSQPIVGYQFIDDSKNGNYFFRVDVGGVVEQFYVSEYIYNYQHRRDVDVATIFADHQLSKRVIKFEDGKTSITKIGSNGHRYSWYNDRGPQPFRDMMIEKAKQAGYELKNITKEQCTELLKAEGFNASNLVFVLKNGHVLTKEST